MLCNLNQQKTKANKRELINLNETLLLQQTSLNFNKKCHLNGKHNI